MKTTVEILDQLFRLAMQEGRADPKKKHDIIELSEDQKHNIMEHMRCTGRTVTKEEIDLCFRSFRREYWKKHRLPPRTKDDEQPIISSGGWR